MNVRRATSLLLRSLAPPFTARTRPPNTRSPAMHSACLARAALRRSPHPHRTAAIINKATPPPMPPHPDPRRLSAVGMPAGTSAGARRPAHSSAEHAAPRWPPLARPGGARKRGHRLSRDMHKRTFFGVGEIVRVVTNPAETLRSLTESRRMLEDARREIEENRERAQLRPSHTFSCLPGFFPRPAELQAVGRTLEEEPCFTVLFGASSVGKTALLRQLLSADKYHVLHFDLRIAGFADLDSLYMSLSQQMEQFFATIARARCFEDFEREAWGFKHDRLHVERRIAESSTGAGQIRTSDIARLMELFQSSLLKYREFEPGAPSDDAKSAASSPRNSAAAGGESAPRPISQQQQQGKAGRFKWFRRGASTAEQKPRREGGNAAEERPAKKMPVFFLDEAHKLPGLIQSIDAMKSLLDSMLVLTKQDRLCHVIHSTSDPFYQTWLRQLNVMQHCKIITIGDCSKVETQSFFRERLVPRIPPEYRPLVDFERLYEVFGGRLVHWQDYITDFVNSNGQLEVHDSSHFIQAHALLNLHIIHSAQAPEHPDPNKPPTAPPEPGAPNGSANPAPGGGGGGGGARGFSIYSPLTGPPRNPHAHASAAPAEPGYASDFTALQLLRVMSRLTQPGVRALSYFMLCREFGVRAVDGMVKGRILDLRWMDPVTREGGESARDYRPGAMGGAFVGGGVGGGMPPRAHSPAPPGARERPRSLGVHMGASSSGTAIVAESIEGDMVAISEREAGLRGELFDDGVDEIFGPKVVPATPIMRFAMREVVAEYQDTGSVSEYASLADMDEY